MAGAGIGGLTAAIALARRGIRVRVLERAAERRPAGAGLALQANAMTALARLGLEAAVTTAGAAIARAAILTPSGRQLGPDTDVARIFRNPEARTVALHRARLHDVLLAAAEGSPSASGAGGITVRTGVAVAGFEQSAASVTVHCADGERLDTALLVGADGLHSAVRAQLVGDGEPIYAGYTSWRGTTPAGAVPPPPRVTETWGRGERFGLVDIGRGETYWFAVADAAPRGADTDARAGLLARFGAWHAPIRAVLEATPPARILRTDIADRDPISRWHDRRVVLLGDAAHPMTPNLGQGAGQAIEDAVALAECLSTRSTLPEALRAYEAARVARANAFVLASRRFGRIAQWRHPVAAGLRDIAMRLTPERVLIAQARAMIQEG